MGALKKWLRIVVFITLNKLRLDYIFEGRRRSLFLVFDIFLSIASFYAAYLLRFDGVIPANYIPYIIKMLPFIIFLRAGCFIYFGLYQTLWQYLGSRDIIAIIKAVTVSSLLLVLVSLFLNLSDHPRSILIMDWGILILALGGSRVLFKSVIRLLDSTEKTSRNILIIGTGDMAALLIREFQGNSKLNERPVGIIDKTDEQLGARIHGVKILGNLKRLQNIIQYKSVDEVIIAMTNLSRLEITDIIKTCNRLNVPCRILPETLKTFSAEALTTKLRPVDVSDLLQRDLVETDLNRIRSFFSDKTVLVTGAGGSIGSELCRLIFAQGCREVILIDYSENNLYEIEMDLHQEKHEKRFVSYLCDVANKGDLEKIFAKHRPQIVYHAAAYKHVPMLERHYKNGVINNICSTRNVVDLSIQYEVSHFCMISTDKAINPVNIMGATKRICEVYVQSKDSKKTKLLTVRFGNVFNSRGSVVPLFQRQIQKGEPITITHPDVTRYFMGISEAVYLILESTLLGKNSEIFMLDMGKPIKISDLAYSIGEVMGIPKEQLPIKYIGLRPGEKLYEEINADKFRLQKTSNSKINILLDTTHVVENLPALMDDLIQLAQKDESKSKVIEVMRAIIPEFCPQVQHQENNHKNSN